MRYIVSPPASNPYPIRSSALSSIECLDDSKRQFADRLSQLHATSPVRCRRRTSLRILVVTELCSDGDLRVGQRASSVKNGVRGGFFRSRHARVMHSWNADVRCPSYRKQHSNRHRRFGMLPHLLASLSTFLLSVRLQMEKTNRKILGSYGRLGSSPRFLRQREDSHGGNAGLRR